MRWHGRCAATRCARSSTGADLLLVTSRHESGPLVVLEAAVAGVPTVGTAVGHLAEWAPRAAAVVPVGDAAALARETAALLADDARRVALAAEAQRLALGMDARPHGGVVRATLRGRGPPMTDVDFIDFIDFIPTADPLLRAPRLAYVFTLPVLGIVTCFETNSAYVLGVVESAFGDCTCGAPRRGRRRRACASSCARGLNTSRGARRCGHVCPDATRLLVHTPGSVAVADPDRRESVAYVTTALVADRGHFRSAVLEAITLALLAHLDRHPVHAAALRGADGRAVLLAGPSGSGKSTLAYLAHDAGFDVLGDDRVWVQREPALRVWGWPGQMRLTLDAPHHFPALAGVGETSVVGGKEKLVVDVVGAAPRPATRAVVCLLARGPAAELERLSAE